MPAPQRAATTLPMTAQLIDGRRLAAEVKNQVRSKIEAASRRGSRRPALAVVKVGNDPASEVYVRNKRRACEEVGILSVAHDLGGSTSEIALLSLIDELNRDAAIDGILVQLPLPRADPADRGHRGDRPGQGRRRLPSLQRGAPRAAHTRDAALHALWRHQAARATSAFHSRDSMPWSSARPTSSAGRCRSSCC